MKTNEEFFKVVVEHALEEDMTILYRTFISLISADNNRKAEDIKTNCELLQGLINVLNEYQDNEKLQDIRNKAIQYNELYY